MRQHRPRLVWIALSALVGFTCLCADVLPARAGNAPSYEAAVLADNPVLLYRLDDAGAPVLNRAPLLGPCQSVFDGAPNSGVALNAAGFVRPGAAAFNGVNGVITIPSPSSCGPGFTPLTTFSAEAWFNAPPSFTARGYFVTLLGTTSGIGIDGGRVFGLVNLQTPTSVPEVTSSDTFNDGHWHHAALTDDGVTLRLYVDGGLQGVTTGFTGTLAFDAGTQGAIGSNGSSFFGGSLQEVAGYATALPASRIAAHVGAATAPVNRFPADFDGDGRTDISIFRPSAGDWFSLPSAGGAGVSMQYGAAGDVVIPADYDGDGKADVAIFRPPAGLWVIHRSTDGDDRFVTYGVPGDIPVPADYDGDGRADIAVYRPAVGTWFIHRSLDNVDALTTFGGISGDVPVAADYDGDGKADIAIFRPSTGLWAIRNSSGAGDQFVTYGGIGGDVPVPGDYDGDGKADLAIFRPSTATWFVHRSTDGEGIVTFGLPTDQPLPQPAVP